MTRTRVTRPIASVGTPFLIVENSFQWLDTLSKQMGSHALKMGAEVTRIRSERFQGFPGNAQITNGGSYTTPVVGQSLEALRDGTADLLMDAASDYQAVYVLDGIRLRGTRYSWFVQDDWRVTRKLSLSIGIRHDIFSPFGELRDRMTNFDVAGGVMVLPESTRSTVAGALGLSGGNLPPTFRYTTRDQVFPKTQYTNFGPRFGSRTPPPAGWWFAAATAFSTESRWPIMPATPARTLRSIRRCRPERLSSISRC
jgi:outer membrane receptor protein involved in Fe transport